MNLSESASSYGNEERGHDDLAFHSADYNAWYVALGLYQDREPPTPIGNKYPDDHLVLFSATATHGLAAECSINDEWLLMHILEEFLG